MAVKKKKKKKKWRMNSRQKNRVKKKIISIRISYYCLDLLIASSPDISYDKAVWCNDLSVCWYIRVDSLRTGPRFYLGMFWVSFILFPFIAVKNFHNAFQQVMYTP